jgi:hypothetical protein
LGLSLARSTCLAAAGSLMTRKLLAGPADMKPVLRRYNSSNYATGAVVTGADTL